MKMDYGKMTKEQAYAILGLSEDASMADVTERYHQLLKAVHPDVAGDALKDYVARLNDAYHAIKSSDFKPDIRIAAGGGYEPTGRSTWEPACSKEDVPKEDPHGTYGYYYYTKSPDGHPFTYQKAYSYDGHAYGTPTPEDTRNQRRKSDFLLSLKKMLFPLIYNFLTPVIRVAAVLSLLCLTLFILEMFAFGKTQMAWVIRSVVFIVTTVVLILLKYSIYKAAEADFVWNQEFRI